MENNKEYVLNTNYVFNTKDAYSQSLIHLINIYFNQPIIGVEVGASTCTGLLTIVEQCSNIDKMYGIDPYKPYVNFIKEPYDGSPFYVSDEKQSDYQKITAKHNISYSSNGHKVILIEEESLKAVKNFEDLSIDFIFLDGYGNSKEIKEDLEAWYPKIKNKGLFSGHDWESKKVQEIVSEFRNKNNIKNTLSTFDNVWAWIK